VEGSSIHSLQLVDLMGMGDVKMGWNIKDAWPESNKVTVRRWVKKLQHQTKTPEEIAEARSKRIEKLRQQLSKLEQEDE